MKNLSADFFTDFHPYLLSGTDPWALPEEKTVSLLNYLKTKGIDHIYCTPPVKVENPANTPAFLQSAFRSFQQRFSTDCKLKLAGRYRLDGGFEPLLTHNNVLSIGIYLIVDVSPMQIHKDTFVLLDVIQKAGYIPVVVQPERTMYWSEDDFLRLKQSGAQLMLNLYSLFGYNGDQALAYSRWMLSEKMYTYVCSGMEDTRIMWYSERFEMNADDISIIELGRLEANGRLLWNVTENNE